MAAAARRGGAGGGAGGYGAAAKAAAARPAVAAATRPRRNARGAQAAMQACGADLQKLCPGQQGREALPAWARTAPGERGLQAALTKMPRRAAWRGGAALRGAARPLRRPAPGVRAAAAAARLAEFAAAARR